MTVQESPASRKGQGPAGKYAERPDSRARGGRAGQAVRRAAADRRKLGGATGWHGGPPDWRLDAWQANRLASDLESRGWRAESVNLAQGIALVEVRRLRVRGTPLVATIRTPGEAAAFLGAGPAAGDVQGSAGCAR